MQKLLSDTLWGALRNLEKSAPKQAAVAYVSSDAVVKFGRGDILVTDASDQAVKSGETSALVLSRAHRRKARVFSYPGLHAKVLVFGRVAVIGSSNISLSSAQNLIEAAVVTDDASVVAVARAFIESLVDGATVIDDHFLRHALALPVSPRRVNSRKKVAFRPKTNPAPRTWLVNIQPLDEDQFLGEKVDAERGTKKAERLKSSRANDVEWVRYTGQSRFRKEARAGDSVIEIWKAHWNAKRATVFRHAPILLRQDEEACTRFYVETTPHADDDALSWSQFLRLAKRVRVPRPISLKSVRPIADDDSRALDALWEKA